MIETPISPSFPISLCTKSVADYQPHIDVPVFFVESGFPVRRGQNLCQRKKCDFLTVISHFSTRFTRHDWKGKYHCRNDLFCIFKAFIGTQQMHDTDIKTQQTYHTDIETQQLRDTEHYAIK